MTAREIDSDEINALMKSVLSVNTFDQASDLVSRCKAVVSDLDRAIEELTAENRILTQQLEQKKQGRSFLGKVFGSSDERQLNKQLSSNKARAESYKAHRENLSELIEEMPLDKNGANVLIKESRLELKELKLQKRELNEQQRQIRTKAREARANVSATRLFTSSKARGTQRSAITLQEQSALSPIEDQKTEIEKKILGMEKYIAWLSRLE